MTDSGESRDVPDCYRCGRDEDERDGLGFWHWTMSHMFLCPTCGNKRCPKATDHRNVCTGSNEPGQAGSRYGGHSGRKE
jgi:hypothetical protein